MVSYKQPVVAGDSECRLFCQKTLSATKLSPEQERAQALALLDAGFEIRYVAMYLQKSERWVRK